MSEKLNNQIDRLQFAANDALRKLELDVPAQRALAEHCATWWSAKMLALAAPEAHDTGPEDYRYDISPAGTDEECVSVPPVEVEAPCGGETGETMAAHFVAIDSFPKDTIGPNQYIGPEGKIQALEERLDAIDVSLIKFRFVTRDEYEELRTTISGIGTMVDLPDGEDGGKRQITPHDLEERVAALEDDTDEHTASKRVAKLESTVSRLRFQLDDLRKGFETVRREHGEDIKRMAARIADLEEFISPGIDDLSVESVGALDASVTFAR